MKTRTALVISILFFLVSNIFPQQFQGAEVRLNELKERLKLTEEQSQQIKSILDTNIVDMQNFMQENHSREERRKKILEHTKKVDSQIEQILTEEQKKEYAKMKEERREKMRDNYHQRRKDVD
ncbi:MAG: hypothetical protein STSR0008_15990 [Ignavibacterium sp.]